MNLTRKFQNYIKKSLTSYWDTEDDYVERCILILHKNSIFWRTAMLMIFRNLNVSLIK